jgi:hypothetical protein
MKDALGHGSDTRGGPQDAAHQTGVNRVGNRVTPTVLDVVRSNPGGFSVTPSGTQPKGGYMVSLPGHSLIVNEADLAGPKGRDILESYAQQHSAALDQPGAHFGGWTDKTSGKTYLDVSQNIHGKFTAIQKGRARNQISIWDVKRSKEIKTGGTGT